jgi:GNAT superfamily N-acetyltransferase
MQDTPYTLRYATIDDAKRIVYHRQRMFEDMQVGFTPEQFEAMRPAYKQWLVENIGAQTYIGVLIFTGDDPQAIVAGGGMWLMPYPPSPADLSTRRAMIYNVYSEPEHRKKGLAKRIMQRLIMDADLRGIRNIELHASDAGRALYESLGFHATNQMRLNLRD